MKSHLIVAIIFIAFSSLVFADNHLGDDTILPIRPVNYGLDTADGESFALSASIADYSPKWSWLDLENTSEDANKNWITITGCGFKQFAEAVCVFDFKFTSSYSYIHDDSTIYCELPTKTASDFHTLPQVSRLDVVFDGELQTFDVSSSTVGNRVLYVGPFRWGPQIECDDPISPLRGDTSGETITVHGQGFADAALSDLKVWVDDQECTGASVQSDTAISCSAPEASVGGFREINKYSVVSVTWGADSYWSRTSNGTEPECYLHANRMYKYGPEVTDIFPACTSVYGENGAGNTQLTIRGAGFADSAFSASPSSPDDFSYTNDYLIQVTLQPTGSSLKQKPLNLQAIGSVTSDGNGIVFSPPDFYHDHTSEDDGDWADIFNTDATVKIYYRQVNRWYSLNDNNAALSFKYGPIVESISTTRVHAGGKDTVCFTGCGFLNYTDHLEVKWASNPVDDDFCEGQSLTSHTDSRFCCVSTAQNCGTDEDLDFVFHYPELPIGDSSARSVTLGSQVDVDVGPLVTTTTPDRTTVSNPDDIALTGTYFKFAADSTGTNQGWDEFPVMTDNANVNNFNQDYKCSAGLGGNCDVSDGSLSDISLTFEMPDVAEFGETFTAKFEWIRPDSGFNVECAHTHAISFGPTCDDTSIHSTAIFGEGEIIISGTYLDDYDIYVRLCENTVGTCTEADANHHYEEVVNAQINTNTNQIRFNTENWQDQDSQPEEFNRGRRYWAQQFEVLIWFNSRQDDPSMVTSETWEFNGRCEDCCVSTECASGSGRDLVNCDDVNTCETKAKLACGEVRFGPTVSGVTPCKGPISGSTEVTLGATDSTDRWAQPRDDSALSAHNLVTFGSLFGLVGQQSSGSVSTTTVWGATANTNVGVSAIFDACNITAPVIADGTGNELNVAWGPDLYFKSKGDASFALNFGTDEFWQDTTESSDTYGFWYGLPAVDYDQTIENERLTISGLNFENFDGRGNATVSIDGVLVEGALDTGADTVTVYVPPRPFGTIAKVCVHFGDLKCNNHGSVFTGSDESNYRYEICSEEYLVYEPYVGGLKTDSNYRTSGLATTSGSAASGTLTAGGLKYYIQDSFDVFVGQYEASSPSYDNGANEITFDLPTYSAEFNSYASVRVEYETPTRTTTDDDEWHGCSDENSRHWGSVSPDMVHFGPLCSGSHTANGNWLLGTNQIAGTTADPGIYTADDSFPTVDRGSTPENLIVTLSTTFLIDCDVDDYENYQNCGVSLTDEELSNCVHPQHSNALQTLQTGSDTGVFETCLHRAVEVHAAIGSTDPFSGDDLDYSVSGNDHNEVDDGADKRDDQIRAYVPVQEGSVDCNYATFGLYFPDALVTDDTQRYVPCTDDDGNIWKHYYGPSVAIPSTHADNLAVWWRADEDFAEVDKVYRGGATVASLPLFYGFGYADRSDPSRFQHTGSSAENSVRVTIAGATDDFFQYDETGTLRDNVLVPYLSDNLDHGTPVHQDNEVTWYAPVEDDLGTITSVNLFWAPLGSPGNPEICDETIFHFHYGPILTSSDLDECVSPVPIRSEDAAIGPEDVTIFGRAFECCGFEELDGTPTDAATGVTGCLFDTPTRNRAFRANFIRTDQLGQYGDSESYIRCDVPRSEVANERLVGFGVGFNYISGDEYCPDVDAQQCDRGNVESSDDVYELFRTHTDLGVANQGYMDICYGPKLDTTATMNAVRLSGLSGTQCTAGSDTIPSDDYYANAAIVGLDYKSDGNVGSLSSGNINDGYYAECHFETSFGEDIVTSKLTDYDISDSCKAPVFAHQCGDGVDKVYAKFIYPATSNADDDFEYVEHQFQYPSTSSVSDPQWESERTEASFRVDVEQSYAPSGSVDTFIAGRNEVRLPIVSSTVGDYRITVDLAQYEDWSQCGHAGGSFMCIVENDAGYLYRTLDTTDDLDGLDVVTSFASITNTNDAVCQFGRGYFGAQGKLRVLLDPHADKWTVLKVDTPDNGDGSYWHWHASSSMLSKNWGGPAGLEPITFYGAGFCEYSHVKCMFGEGTDRSSYAVQGDIIGDGMVVCQTPPDHAPQVGSLSLSFCGSDASDVLDATLVNNTLPCDCNFGHCETADQISLDFTFVGAENFHPRHGPIYGNTTVYFTNVGLEDDTYYDRIECVFHIDGGEQIVDANPVDSDVNVTVSPPAGTFSCVTPPVIERQHAHVEIRGYYNTFESGTDQYLFDANLGCFWFDYGYPTVRSVSPSSIVFGDTSEVVVVKGDYFNGGSSAGDYRCYWQHGENPSSDLPDELGEDPTFPSNRVMSTEGVRVNVAGNWDGQDFNDFEIHCITPNFDQIGAYPFDVSFDNAEVTSQLHGGPVWRYDVEPSTANIDTIVTEHFDDDDDDTTPITDYYMDELGGIITIQGNGFSGGRMENDDHISGYVCTFAADFNGTSVVRHTIADSDVSDTEVVCIAPYFELTNNDLDTLQVTVSLSVDGGYSLQADSSLEYRSNSDLVECLEDGSAGSLMFASVFLVLSTFLLHFFC